MGTRNSSNKRGDRKAKSLSRKTRGLKSNLITTGGVYRQTRSKAYRSVVDSRCLQCCSLRGPRILERGGSRTDSVLSQSTGLPGVLNATRLSRSLVRCWDATKQAYFENLPELSTLEGIDESTG